VLIGSAIIDTYHISSDQSNCLNSLSILTAILPGEPRLAGFIEAKDNGSGGDNWSYKTCKAPAKSSPPTNQHPTFTGRMPFLSKLSKVYLSHYWHRTPVMWFETIGLRTRPSEAKKNGFGLARCGLGLGSLVLCWEIWSYHARRHNDLEGQNNFSSLFIVSILCLEYHYCGDQQWHSLI